MSDHSNSEIPNGLYYADVAVLAKIFAKRYGTSVNAAYEWLTKDVEVPLADVQPVVRCRNCEHWDDMYGTCYCEDFEVHCQDYYIGDMHTEPDFFCGFGERERSRQ